MNTAVTTGSFQRDWNYFAAQLNCAAPYPAAGQPIGGGSADTMRDAERIVTAVTTSLGGTSVNVTSPLMGGSEITVDPTDPMGTGGGGDDPTNPGEPATIPQEQAEAWTQVAGSTAPSRVLTLAMAQRSQNVNVGALVIPVQVGMTIANWASWSEGGGWQIPTCREQFPFGCIDRAAVDENVALEQIDTSRVANQMGVSGTGGTGGTGETGGTGMVPMGGGIPGLEGIQPTMITQRRCPGPTVLAVNGLCYHRSVLPAQFRANRPRRAPVSYSDAQSIRRGNQAARRIEAYAKRQQANLRKLVRRRPTRRRSTPST